MGIFLGLRRLTGTYNSEKLVFFSCITYFFLHFQLLASFICCFSECKAFCFSPKMSWILSQCLSIYVESISAPLSSAFLCPVVLGIVYSQNQTGSSSNTICRQLLSRLYFDCPILYIQKNISLKFQKVASLSCRSLHVKLFMSVQVGWKQKNTRSSSNSSTSRTLASTYLKNIRSVYLFIVACSPLSMFGPAQRQIFLSLQMFVCCILMILLIDLVVYD